MAKCFIGKKLSSRSRQYRTPEFDYFIFYLWLLLTVDSLLVSSKLYEFLFCMNFRELLAVAKTYNKLLRTKYDSLRKFILNVLYI